MEFSKRSCSFNFLLSTYFLIKCHGGETFESNTVSLNWHRNLLLFSNILHYEIRFLPWSSEIENRFPYFLLSFNFLIKCLGAEQFIIVTVFQIFQQKSLGSAILNYESASSRLNFPVLTVCQFLPHRIFLNKSHSAKSVGNFTSSWNFFLKLLVLSNLKHCIKCCTFKTWNCNWFSHIWFFLFLSIQFQIAGRPGKVTVSLKCLHFLHPQN